MKLPSPSEPFCASAEAGNSSSSSRSTTKRSKGERRGCGGGLLKGRERERLHILPKKYTHAHKTIRSSCLMYVWKVSTSFLWKPLNKHAPHDPPQTAYSTHTSSSRNVSLLHTRVPRAYACMPTHLCARLRKEGDVALHVVGGIQDVDARDLHLVARRALLPHQQPPGQRHDRAKRQIRIETGDGRRGTLSNTGSNLSSHPDKPLRQRVDSVAGRSRGRQSVLNSFRTCPTQDTRSGQRAVASTNSRVQG